jgi:hypothetical protein
VFKGRNFWGKICQRSEIWRMRSKLTIRVHESLIALWVDLSLIVIQIVWHFMYDTWVAPHSGTVSECMHDTTGSNFAFKLRRSKLCEFNHPQDCSSCAHVDAFSRIRAQQSPINSWRILSSLAGRKWSSHPKIRTHRDRQSRAYYTLTWTSGRPESSCYYVTICYWMQCIEFVPCLGSQILWHKRTPMEMIRIWFPFLLKKLTVQSWIVKSIIILAMMHYYLIKR